VSEQHEEESLRRWAREQAEIERQTDALVLRTLTAMVTAAEDLKSKLRRDTESMLEEYRKTKRGLENEIGLSTAERQRFRREIDDERETILAEANAQAKEIVEAAEREREQLLRETRGMEQRLRNIEGQIRSVFGQQGGQQGATDNSTGAPAGRGFTPSAFTRAAAPSVTPALTPPAAPAAAAATPAPVPALAPDDEEDEVIESALVDENEADLIDEDDEAEATVSAAPPVFTPAPQPPIITMPTSAPVAQPAASASRPAASTQRRQVELVFDGVPGYQQASALERAIDDLVPDGEVDIVDFEHGQLVLSVQVADLEALANQLVAASPASLELESVDGDRATFHCS
jgi:hypothetical protein